MRHIWCYRIVAGICWHSVGILWLSEKANLIYSFCLSVAVDTAVWADLSLRYALCGAGTLNEIVNLICKFCLSLAGHTVDWADLSLGYALCGALSDKEANIKQPVSMTQWHWPVLLYSVTVVQTDKQRKIHPQKKEENVVHTITGKHSRLGWESECSRLEWETKLLCVVLLSLMPQPNRVRSVCNFMSFHQVQIPQGDIR